MGRGSLVTGKHEGEWLAGAASTHQPPIFTTETCVLAASRFIPPAVILRQPHQN
ncbi:hypothetical protein KCP71_02335 [Salmonella enterica subsp. enterica]|nr:hypothetical protein KCP71_02335 [Salmonella enterica subsp. enterica]